jgi:putative glutamine amidotransferase
MPRIAVTSCKKLPSYEAAIRRAGAEPVVVDPATSNPADLVRNVDGLLLTGGGDVDPAIYGEETHPSVTGAEPGRDEFELSLCREASAADLPLFAICRGVQVLNVARGGSLVQDIPSQIAHAGPHAVSDPPDAVVHQIALVRGSRLQQLLGDKGSCDVNSRHHQSIKAVGHGLVVTATASDGVIEAVEDPALSFCVGVQWHPENFTHGEFDALFKGLVDASRRRSG